jgi:hypothetical protein
VATLPKSPRYVRALNTGDLLRVLYRRKGRVVLCLTEYSRLSETALRQGLRNGAFERVNL